MIKLMQLLSLIIAMLAISSINASENNDSEVLGDKYAYSCQLAAEAKGEWRDGMNCRGPAGNVIEEVVEEAEFSVVEESN